MKSGGAPPPPPRMPAPSAETAALLTRLTSLADSARPDDQSQLVALLKQATTLDQLDEPAIRDRSRAADLRVALVVSHLSTNRAPVAAQSLAALTRSEAFNSSWQRQELLVRALASQHPLLPDSLTFLDAQSQPDSVNLHLAIDALADNGSEEAIALLGRKLSDPRQETEYKLGWLRGPVLRHRRDPQLLQAANQWLQDSGWPRELHIGLAEALFDYRPEEWFPGREGLPRPPLEKNTSADAARTLRSIGAKVLNADYPAAVKSAVQKTLANLPHS